MKQKLILAGLLASISCMAHAQYYDQGQYYYNQNQYARPTYQQTQTNQNYYQNNMNVSSSLILKPYIGIDYVHSIFHLKEDTKDWFADQYNSVNVSAGLKVYKNFGIEASALISDRQARKEDGYYDGVIPVTVKTEINYHAYSLDAVGFLPISNFVDLIGTLGGGVYVFDEKAQITRTSNGQILEDVSDTETRFAPRLGLGIEFHLNDNFATRIMARGAYLHYDDLDYIFDFQAGLRFYFN